MVRKQKGYTIIEVMIFLAVSGALLTLTIMSMGGRQESVRFRQSMEDIELRIRSTLNNVDQGYAAKADDDKNYNCTGATVVEDQGAGKAARCVFVGREVNFCNATNTYIVSKIAPYNNPDYTSQYSVIAGVIDGNQEPFTVSAGVTLASTTDCRVAALYQALGVSNNRVPRYVATINGAFVPINDNTPAVLCFTNGGKWATITLTQADVKLLVDTPKCN